MCTEYVSCSSLFMKSKGLYLIFFHVSTLNFQVDEPSSLSEAYFPAIGTYLEIVTERCSMPIFFLVANKMDLCKTEEAEVKLEKIMVTAKEHLASIPAGVPS